MTMTPISWRVHRSLVEARESDLSTMIGHLGDTLQLVDGRVRDLPYDMPKQRITIVARDGHPSGVKQSTGLALTTIQDAQQLLRRGDGWNLRLYFDSKKYHVSYWLARIDEQIPLLNRETIFCPAGNIAHLPPALLDLLVGQSGELFVRPDSGLKPFTGFSVIGLSGTAAMRTWRTAARQIAVNVPNLEPERLLCLARAVPLHPVEWRFWIVDRQVVASSPYSWTEDARTWWAPPAGAESVARAMAANAWQPDIAYVIDVAQRLDRSGDDAFTLCEVNAASTSGVYAARFETLLPALRDAMMRENLGELSIEE